MEAKEFVPYNQALALKELGFDEHCNTCYDKLQMVSSYGKNVFDYKNYNTSGYVVSRPTYSQAFRWFRDTHNMFHEIQIDRTTEPKFCYAVFHYEHYGNYEEIKIGDWSLYRTYEAAESACLDSLIEIIQNK